MAASRGTTGSDALVIGGGAVGCSVALHLRWQGFSVRVLERESVGSGTSSRGFGLVWAQTKAPNFYLELSLASIAYYPEFLDAIGDDCDYRRPCGMMLIETEEQWTSLRALMAEQVKTPGFQVDFLDIQQARERESALSEALLGATYSRQDGHLDPKKLVAGIARAARSAGVEIHDGVAVTALHREGSGWVAATTRGRFRAEVVVNCAGVWARDVARMVGVDLPLQAIRGQVLVSPPMPPLLGHPTPDVRQAPDGRIWMGTIYQPSDWDLTVREEDSREILGIAARQVPSLQGTAIEQAWTGLRPVPIDGHPILGALPGLEGRYVAVGHSGITLCHIEGRLLAELIAHGSTSHPLDRFTLNRFGNTPEQAHPFRTQSAS